MIQPTLERLIDAEVEDLLIPADNVANVMTTHTLNHSLLVLSKVKYSLIPVLTPTFTLAGLINMATIMNEAMTLDGFDMEKLHQIRIADIQIPQAISVGLNTPLEKLLHHLIDHNFLCVIDDDGVFIGIVTRRSILKRLTRFLHLMSQDEILEVLTLIKSN